MKKRKLFYLPWMAMAAILFSGCSQPEKVTGDYPIQPVAFNKVHLSDQFWSPRIRLNHDLTIPYAFQQSEETGRVKNFEIAAGWVEGTFCSIYPFDDSDVFKIIEGAAYSMQMFPDPELDAYVDELIVKIAAAQEPDGYLYTNRTIMGDNAHEWAGSKRWELTHDLSHELYNLGHLYEAGVAHYLATGKKSLLDVCTKSADLLVKDLGWGKFETYPGHQEIEIGLVKLYRVTGKQEYLDLAKFFLDVRDNGSEYSQSHMKVVDQTEAVGHAVRANYMYSGVADVAAITGDQAYLNAIGKIWEDVVSKKMYITGGVGSTGHGEAYGVNYYLPNMTAYCETCAAIANVFWNHRMFLLHGESKYLDVLERTLYNGVLSGLGLSGDRFFYPNVLQSKGQHERSAWFGCACCPSNLTRFLPSIPGYVYGVQDDHLFVNLFIEGESEVELASGLVKVKQTTQYPWEGRVELTLNPEKSGRFTLKVRIPGWSGNEAVPSDLYTFADVATGVVSFEVNGRKVSPKSENGFALITRKWKAGDVVVVNMPLEIKRIRSHELVEANAGRIAIQRGPLVYCLEWPDQPDGKVLNTMLADEPGFSYRFDPEKLNGVGEILMKGLSLRRNAEGGLDKQELDLTAIPYYSWANRGRGEMTVWIPEVEEAASPLPSPTLASMATVTTSPCKGSPSTINDQLVPDKSSSTEYGYIHWWPTNSSDEWVQYEFSKPEPVSAIEVFWFDDEDLGAGCRVPKSWKLKYKKDNRWMEVQPKGEYGLLKDQFNRLEFQTVTTTALKIELRLPDRFSSGIQEWVVY